MPGYNVHEAIEFLGERLEDKTNSSFNRALRLILLENSETQAAHLLNDKYLSELETLEESVAVSSGKTLLTALANGVLRSGEGILQVKIHGGKICNKLPIKDLKITETTIHEGSTDDPMWWPFHNTINVLPATTSLIDVSYLRLPPPLLYKFTVVEEDTPSTTVFKGTAGQGLLTVDDTYNGVVICNAVESKKTYHVVTDYTGSTLQFTVTAEVAAEPRTWDSGDEFYFLTKSFSLTNIAGLEFTLNPSLHEIILLLAEAACWAQTKETTRRDSAQNKAIDIINLLNAKYEDPKGVGTDSLRRQGR